MPDEVPVQLPAPAPSKSFMTRSGGHVRIWGQPHQPALDVPGDGTVSREVGSVECRILEECPEIVEVVLPVINSVDPNPIKQTGLPRSLTFYGSEFIPAQAIARVTQGTLGAPTGASTTQRIIVPATTLTVGVGEAWVVQGGKNSAKVPFEVKA